MATLIAIGYPNETTASGVVHKGELAVTESVVEPDAVAVISRDKEGTFHMQTTHDPTGEDTPWAIFWGLLFGYLVVPSFAVAVEAGLAGTIGRVEKSCTEPKFRDQARDMLQPGTSALFLVVASEGPDLAADAVGGQGGTVITSSISGLFDVVPERGPAF